MGSGRKKKDNRGMSLVELIIVIAIMGIVIGVTGYGLALVSKKPVDECAKKIEMVLNQTRTNAMGSTEAYVEFFLEDDCVTLKEYLQNNVRQTSTNSNDDIAREVVKVVGAEGVKIRFYSDPDSDPNSYMELGTDNKCQIGFKRDSGSVIGDPIYTEIRIYKGDYENSYIRTITIDSLTGRVKLQ